MRVYFRLGRNPTPNPWPSFKHSVRRASLFSIISATDLSMRIMR